MLYILNLFINSSDDLIIKKIEKWIIELDYFNDSVTGVSIHVSRK